MRVAFRDFNAQLIFLLITLLASVSLIPSSYAQQWDASIQIGIADGSDAQLDSIKDDGIDIDLTSGSNAALILNILQKEVEDARLQYELYLGRSTNDLDVKGNA